MEKGEIYEDSETLLSSSQGYGTDEQVITNDFQQSNPSGYYRAGYLSLYISEN